MRRIYESDALHRDDSDPFSPNEDRFKRTRSIWSVDGSLLGRFVPRSFRSRSVSISVSTPRSEYVVGDSIPFRVTMKNAMPLPVSIRTRNPMAWSWDVDGVQEASHVPLRDPPDEPRKYQFERGERKRFTRRWNQMFKVDDAEWEPADPGEYTIGVWLNVDDPAEKGLYDETTVRIVRE